MQAKPITCVSVIIASTVFLAASPAASAQTCQPHWSTSTPLIGDPGLNGRVLAMTVFDDGAGPALYVGGTFTTAGGVETNGVAKWDGSSWSSLGTIADNNGNPSYVYALAVFDDGTGPALYAGGEFKSIGGIFTTAIAKWDGSTWSNLGSGNGISTPGFQSGVQAFAVFNDGSGPALYVGGSFLFAGGLEANSIAKWDGSSWSTLGAGIRGIVKALEVFDDGTGSALYAGGFFVDKSGMPASAITKWDGSSFSPLGGGLTSVFSGPTVFALDVFDDGSGPALYAAGRFTAAGDVEASSVAKWDGSSWSALGTIVNNYVGAMTVFDDGSGAALYIGGIYINGTGSSSAGTSLARWDGSSWSVAGRGIQGGSHGAVVETLTVFDDGTGPALYVGGNFTQAGGAMSYYIAQWNGCPTVANPADLNGDGVVNGSDLMMLLSQWGPCPPPPTVCAADLNSDGVVDAADLATLLANWSP